MPGDWMATNHILCQQNYKKEASEVKYTNWQHLSVESLCVWTSGVKQSAGKTGSGPFIPPIIIKFPPLSERLYWSALTMAGFETLAIWQALLEKKRKKSSYETQ